MNTAWTFRRSMAEFVYRNTRRNRSLVKN